MIPNLLLSKWGTIVISPDEQGSAKSKYQRIFGSLDRENLIQYFYFESRSTEVDPIFSPWICIKSSWSNFFFLDFDQLVLILYFFSGFRSSQVDPIFYFWIFIKSSWSNTFCTGFESSRVDPIFYFWILVKWRDIFCCTQSRYFFVGSSPAALWRPCAS